MTQRMRASERRPSTADEPAPIAATGSGPQAQVLPRSTPAVRADRSWPGPARERALALVGLVLSAGFLLFLALPLVALVLRVPPTRLVAALGGPEAGPALILSAQTTAASLAVTVLCGLPLAYVLARVRFPGKSVIETLLTLPTVLPPAVAGVALLVAFGRRGLFGHVLADMFGVTLPFTTVAVVMAQVFVSAPYFVNTARNAIAQLDRSFEQAAGVDGATRTQTLLRITVPLIAPALYTGAALAWARALGEFGATIIFAGSFLGRTETAPLAIYFAAESDFETAIALSVVLLALSFVVLLAVRLLRPGGETTAGGLG